MANEEQKQEQRQALPKMVGLKDEPYYANCLTVEMSPYDIAILFGKVRPGRDANGQGQLVEMYDRQVYLSHLQAKALHDALGRSLTALSLLSRKPESGDVKPENAVLDGGGKG